MLDHKTEIQGARTNTNTQNIQICNITNNFLILYYIKNTSNGTN